ncbi:MAG TPA: ABC transporter permease [Rhodanobacteraceae bacterium]|nr:ABC transporter permease [Rhodanobacteraceae bacterium]
MFGYYLDLALRSFKRNKTLTALMVLALGLGIGASITTLTVLKLLSGDPLPQKSTRLFTPQIDPRPAKYAPVAGAPPPYGGIMSYADAMNLLHAHKAKRQAAVAVSELKISPLVAGEHPYFGNGVLTTVDFFSMFDAPFEYGSGWSAQDGKSRARVAVISAALNNKQFGGRNSVGRTVRVADHDYRIIGVLQPWAPQPNFYSVNTGGDSYGDGDAVFLPLQSALADQIDPNYVFCWAAHHDSSHLKTAPCAMVSVWVELANAADAVGYKTFLSNYVHQQIALGRYHIPNVWLPNLKEFLARLHVVPDDTRLQTYLAFGFLLICVVGTVGLLLAKCLKRSHEIGVRRALGASRAAIFAQFMVESGMVGLAGGVLGLAFAEFGLWEIRHEPTQYAHLARLDPAMFVATFVIALIASLIAGLLPAWRACVVAPAPQLKSV